MRAQDVLAGFIAEVWNAHDITAFPRFVSPDVRFHGPRGPPRDYEGYVAMARDFLAAFPDLRFDVERSTGDGELVSARLVITGTNSGPFRGRAATGKSVRVVGHPMCRVRDGRVVEFWQLFDELSMLHQLGHVADATLLGVPPTPATGR